MIYVKSLLDTDLYKITMQCAVLNRYPKVQATYGFINRRKTDVLTPAMIKLIREGINSVSELRASIAEVSYLADRCPYLPEDYLGWLLNFRPNPSQVKIDDDGRITVAGPWHEAIWWEVPLLATISEVFCGVNDRTKGHSEEDNLSEVEATTREKCRLLFGSGCSVIEMGTRRRRSYSVQNEALRVMAECVTDGCCPIIGTSNIHLAHKYDFRPMGTMAHEWIMGVSALESLRHANRYALRAWDDVFESQCNTALTDTYGTDAFIGDFDTSLARVYDATRHDSGCPYAYGEKIIAHYERLRINPKSKSIVFSDGLDTKTAIDIQKKFSGAINVFFGIGTHWTNDFKNRQAMNIVVKLTSVDGIQVCKLSDVPGKASGDPNAVKAAKYVFLGEPLV